MGTRIRPEFSKARMVPAVPSGRRASCSAGADAEADPVADSPAAPPAAAPAVTAYISFMTTSDVSPRDRANRRVSSTTGVWIGRKPKLRAVVRKRDSTASRFSASSGSASCIPRTTVTGFAGATAPADRLVVKLRACIAVKTAAALTCLVGATSGVFRQTVQSILIILVQKPN